MCVQWIKITVCQGPLLKKKKSKLQNAVCSQGAKTLPLYFGKNNSTREGSERLLLIPSLEPRTVYRSSYSHVIVWLVRLDLHSIFPVNTNSVMVLHYYACVQCACEVRRRMEMERYNERETERERLKVQDAIMHQAV